MVDVLDITLGERYRRRGSRVVYVVDGWDEDYGSEFSAPRPVVSVAMMSREGVADGEVDRITVCAATLARCFCKVKEAPDA